MEENIFKIRLGILVTLFIEIFPYIITLHAYSGINSENECHLISEGAEYIDNFVVKR